ncbi:MAG: HNH endonuclease signature motif containing protein, partial [Cryobacterium sp.]
AAPAIVGVRGSAAPLVMIHVNVRDLDTNREVGWIDGQEAPISMRAVKQAICSGGYQGVLFDENDAFVKLGKKNRCFTPKQRLAISCRDGGCVIPGCDVPAYWTQIHHVKAWAKDHRTEIDNGVCICRRHHAEIESSGWQIMMVRGRPMVRGPAWVDPSQTWRPAQTHRANRAVSA